LVEVAGQTSKRDVIDSEHFVLVVVIDVGVLNILRQQAVAVMAATVRTAAAARNVRP